MSIAVFEFSLFLIDTSIYNVSKNHYAAMLLRDQPQIRGSAARMVQMLRRSQDILDELREAIRSSSTIWDSDAADETSHSTGVIRPAVLVVQIRDCDLGNRIGRLHQSRYQIQNEIDTPEPARAEGVAADCAFGFSIHTAGVSGKSWLARWMDGIKG